MYVRFIRVSEYVLDRMSNPLIWPNITFNLSSLAKKQKENIKIIHNFSRRLILQRDAEFDPNTIGQNNKRIAFLDFLLKFKREDPTITFDDVQEEVNTLMIAGHESTAVAIGWVCHLIGWHPDVQKKIHQEIDRVIGIQNLIFFIFNINNYTKNCHQKVTRIGN